MQTAKVVCQADKMKIPLPNWMYIGIYAEPFTTPSKFNRPFICSATEGSPRLAFEKDRCEGVPSLPPDERCAMASNFPRFTVPYIIPVSQKRSAYSADQAVLGGPPRIFERSALKC